MFTSRWSRNRARIICSVFFLLSCRSVVGYYMNFEDGSIAYIAQFGFIGIYDVHSLLSMICCDFSQVLT
jgi:hypothetical protein